MDKFQSRIESEDTILPKHILYIEELLMGLSISFSTNPQISVSHVQKFSHEIELSALILFQ